MRRSEAAVALIRREEDGQTSWLAQWNENWRACNFVGGHRRSEETFRECLLRELAEELRLREGIDYAISAEPPTHLEYQAWSEGARAETRYTMDLFEVGLGSDAGRAVGADPRNRWLSTTEIARGWSQDGRPVSATMRDLLARAGIATGSER